MSEDSGRSAIDDHLVAGNEALARGDWDEATICFEAAISDQETPEALEGLGMAAWWRDDADVTISTRERAYRLYREQGDSQGAARVATYLAHDYYSFRGEYALANGWLQRAHRLLDGQDAQLEHALLAVYEGALRLEWYNDTLTAQTLGVKAAAISQSLGVFDLEMVGVGLEGLARVCAGDVVTGMQRLDESTTAAVSGEVSDPDACSTICCFMIYACKRVRDYDRAMQWCKYVEELAKRWNCTLMFSLCRTHYAGILVWRGQWMEAETILKIATNSLLAIRPVEAVEGIIRLADLRRRQGRFEESSQLLTQVETYPFQTVGANLALVERAALALEQHNDAATAANLCERFLRNLPSDNQLDRATALELLTLSQVALGAINQAQATCAELRAIALAVGTQPLQATAAFAEGIVAAAHGDYETARRQLEDALHLYERSGALFETARARIRLADTLVALRQVQAAGQQAQKAEDILQQLGAVAEANRATTLLRDIKDVLPEEQTEFMQGAVSLTSREVDILRLIATGKSNREIAATLVLSVRTVERHISNIYAKLGINGVTARATATAYAFRHGLVPSA